MADTIEYEEGFDFGGNTSDDANPIVPFRQDSLNLVDIVEEQGMTYQYTITAIKALDLSYCPKYAYCFANEKLYEYDATSTTAADDIDVLMPTSLVGRWIKIKDYSATVAVSKTYVDEQDAATLVAAQSYTDARCEDGAEVNTISTISVNSVDVPPDENKNVEITVPTKTSDLTNDDNFIADADYTHTDNNYTDAAAAKLAAIEAAAQVNVIETVKVNGVALAVTNKAVDVTTTKGDDGDSAYEVAAAEGYEGSQTEWVASLKGKDGTLWKYTATNLTVGSDVVVSDLTGTFSVDDLVMSTGNNVWGIIKSIAGTDAIVTGLAQGGGDGTDGTNGTNGIDGATWISGTAVPTTEGVDGDYYLRTTNYEIYKKTGGTWNSIGNIKGLTGNNGADGATWISKTATPTTEGNDGDYYLNTTDYEIYKKISGTWNSIGNIKGADGADGVVDPTSISQLPSDLTDTDKILVIRNNTVYLETAAKVKTYMKAE